MKWLFGAIWHAIYQLFGIIVELLQIAGALLRWTLLVLVFFLVAIKLDYEKQPMLAFGVALAASLFLKFLYDGLTRRRRSGDGHIRGTRLISFKDAEKIAKKWRSSVGDRAPIPWGGLLLPQSIAPAGFLIMGVPGSGKTITIDLLLKAVLTGRQRAADTRAVIFDAKTDSYVRLKNMGVPEENIRLLNPFDQRCYSWNISKDLQRPELFPEFAATLFPKEKSSEPFFDNATRDLLHGVLLSFHNCWPITSRPWSLRDVYLAMSHKPWLIHVLAWYPDSNSRRIEQYFSEPKTANNVMASLSPKLQPYEAIAAYWHNAEKANHRFSFEDWKTTNTVLVFPNSHTAAETIRAISQALYKRLFQTILDLPMSDERRIWILLDEMGKAGKLPLLDDLIVKGRDRGACVVAGVQDINAVHDAYGPNLFQEILALLGNELILRLKDEPSARWAEGIFGRPEVYQASTSRGGSRTGVKETATWQTTWNQTVKPLVLASEFQALDLPKGEKIEGFYSTSGIGVYKWAESFERVRKELTRQTTEDAKENLILWPAEKGFLETWSQDELAALSLPALDTGGAAKRPVKSTTPFTPTPPSASTEDVLRNANEVLSRAREYLGSAGTRADWSPFEAMFTGAAAAAASISPPVESANTKPKLGDDEKPDDEAWDDFVRDRTLSGLPPEDLPNRSGAPQGELEDLPPSNDDDDDTEEGQERLDYRH